MQVSPGWKTHLQETYERGERFTPRDLQRDLVWLDLSPQSAFTAIYAEFLAVCLFNFELSRKGEGGEEDEEGQRSRGRDQREAATLAQHQLN